MRVATRRKYKHYQFNHLKSHSLKTCLKMRENRLKKLRANLQLISVK